MEKVSLLLDGASSAHEALIIDGDMFQSADRELATLKYLLWLESDSGGRLRGGVRISGDPERPPLLKVFARNAHPSRPREDGILVSEVDNELYFDDRRERLELCLRGVGPLAKLVFRHHAMYWETAAGDGQLVVASPVVFGDALSALGPRLRVSALA